LNQFVRNIAALVALGVRSKKIGEEEETKHKEHNEQLHQNDEPKHTAGGHGAKAVDIEPANGENSLSHHEETDILRVVEQGKHTSFFN
jgi:hypothetical protein